MRYSKTSWKYIVCIDSEDSMKIDCWLHNNSMVRKHGHSFLDSLLFIGDGLAQERRNQLLSSLQLITVGCTEWAV